MKNSQQTVSVSVVGPGNVGLHLYARLLDVGTDVRLFGRKEEIVTFQDRKINCQDISYLKSTANDVVILCLPDDEIKHFSEKIHPTKALVVHVSGTKPIEEIINNRRAVCYFFQSISKADSNLDFPSIPVYLETKYSEDFDILASLLEKIGCNWKKIDSKTRSKLHLCGVFVNNFGNQILGICENVLETTDLTLSDLVPLYKKTIDKAILLGSEKAQTGPAMRGDENTVMRQQEILRTLDEDAFHLYSMFTQRIKNIGTKPE